MTKEEKKKLLYKPEHGFDRLTAAEEAEMNAYCEDYKAFLDASKTERECVFTAIRLAEQHGFAEYKRGMKLQPGDKVYYNNRGKAIMLAVIGTLPLSAGANIGAAHTDAPRLDLKPNPLYEDAELAARTSGARFRWSCTARGRAPTAARCISKLETIPPIRSLSSTICCRIWAVSRAKSP